jgi:flagellar hook-associated protein 1 FlgK
MSVSDILNVAQSALAAQQFVMNTTAENIANANTPGYTVEQAVLTPTQPLLTPEGSVGTGVTVASTARLRDTFLDETYRTESGLSGQYTTAQNLLNQVQSGLGEPGSSGISSALDGFFNAFTSLTSDPTNSTDLTEVQQAGATLAQSFQNVSGALATAGQSAVSQLQSNVTQANQLLSQIQTLNQQIVAAQSTGGAPTLQDQRDTAIDQLSSLMGVSTVNYPDGAVGVLAGGTVLADGTQHATLSVVSSGAGYGVSINGSATAATIRTGSIGAVSAFTQTTLPTLQGQLNTLASSLVTAVNTLSESGTVTGSNPPVTGVPFFNPAGTTAASIGLSAQVQASTANIVTGTTGNAGDSTIAAQIGQLAQTSNAALGNQSIPTYYAGFVSGIGAQAQAAQQSATAQATLVANTTTQRDAADGVNTDTELIDMIQTQEAYSAATHLVSTADAMVQSLLQAVQS